MDSNYDMEQIPLLVEEGGGHEEHSPYTYDSNLGKNASRFGKGEISSRNLFVKKITDWIQDSDGFKPKKYFSIDRVFRNEALDATHLAEFHQIEFLVADRNLSLGHLIGLLSNFFERIGKI